MNREPEWDETLELLREAHQEPLAQDHFDAVRARVLERLRPQPRRVWWPVWACASVIATGVVVWMALVGEPVRLPRTGRRPAPPIAAAVPQVLQLPPVVSKPKVRRVQRVKKAPPPPAAEPLLVKLITDDPDVVIYWIADPKGD